ncbi:major facilitator superfamily domain-containing protein [Halteromyces radiatus]|uniref:major facilitator superfamily domain-containing protein n=1 Tax=Halteromyces radiatus TaxID=101107 RepID=UPI00222090C5|nr:major facilitator superfamily domain-containing protein [Halteromyces radiatus]KAI8097466.1 major facilitator superfamily domain-containing protein [Halteromyces radiatus]
MIQSNNETSPLLGNNHVKTYDQQETSSINSDDTGHITILTSNTHSTVNTLESKHNDQDDNNDIVAKRLKGVSLYTILFGLWVGVSLAALDSSIVATIYTQIGTEFKRSNEIIWIATSYMLSYTALQPLYGRISDIFGRKNALIFATTFFFVGSLLCGAANDLWTLVFARAIAGIGGGGINTLTTVMVSDLVPLRQRGTFQGYGNIAYAVGGIAGAPLGGFLTDTIGWRYCFYINLPLLLVTIYVSTCLLTNYNLEEEMETDLWERFKKIDYLGAFTVVMAVIAFLTATSLGGNLRPWSDPLVVGCLVTAGILTILFCVVEAKWATNPLMPWHIISSQTPLACSSTNFWTVMASTGTVYIMPLYFQALLGYTPTHAGLYYLPKVLAVSLGSVLSGIYMSRTGEYIKISTFGAIACLLSMTGYACWTPSTSSSYLLLCLFGDGFSLGIILTTTLIAMLSCVESKDMATITSMSYLYRSAGGVIGISTTSAIFQAIIKTILTEKITGPDAQLYIDIARKSMTDVRSLLPPDVLEIVLDSYQTALRYSFGACAGMAILSVLSTFFIQRFELQTKIRK